MVWTILCTVTTGLSGVLVLGAIPVILQMPPPHGTSTTQHLMGLVLPLLFIAIMFSLHTWWLVVVFKFYNRHQYSTGDQPSGIHYSAGDQAFFAGDQQPYYAGDQQPYYAGDQQPYYAGDQHSDGTQIHYSTGHQPSDGVQMWAV